MKNNNSSSFSYVGLIAICTGIGAIKGLMLGLKRTSKRRETNNFRDDGGPIISYNDDLFTIIGSTGVIITINTMSGGIQGLCVGLLSPVVIPCGLYHYYKNKKKNNQLN